MRKSRFSEHQIAFILKQVDDGLSVQGSAARQAFPSRPITGGARSTVG